jgi:hypothetical protein
MKIHSFITLSGSDRTSSGHVFAACTTLTGEV